MQFLPINDGIMCRALDRLQEVTGSGIGIAEEKRRVVDRPSMGQVIAIGPNVTKVGIGDKIYFDKYNAVDIFDQETNETLVALKEPSCLGRLQ